MTQNTFRYDINALRALAVVCVVLFHFQVPLFASGYLGVDIFFVISGYLMTKVICEGHLRGHFSFAYFFFSRAKRIIPALTFLCFILIVAGWFYFLPIEYRQLGKHVVSSQIFLSNFIFAGEAGYFDVDSAKKYLLHTWSLSVEWQFYLLLPFLISAVYKTKKSYWLLFLFVALIFFSFAYSISSNHPENVYYSLLSRAWEMLLGGLVYLLPSLPLTYRSRKLYMITVILLWIVLLLSTILIGSQTVWPNYLTIAPVFATALLIWLNSNVRLFSIAPIRYIGDVSYSLYLWHWPVAVLFLNIFDEFSFTSILLGISFSFALAHLSYRYIENPARLMQLSLFNVLKIVLPIFVVSTAALYIYKTNGMPAPNRVDSKVSQADLEFLNREPRKNKCLTTSGHDSSYCRYGTQSNIELIVFGDSHASSVVTAVQRAFERKGAILFVAKAGCPSFIAGDIRKDRGGECRLFVEKQLAIIKEQFPGVPILVVSRWAYYFLGDTVKNPEQKKGQEIQSMSDAFTRYFGDTWCPIATNRKVYALTPIPEYWDIVPKYIARSLQNKSDLEQLSRADFDNRNQFIFSGLNQMAEQCGVTLIHSELVLCDSKVCFLEKDSRPIYYDNNHLSEWGNKLLTPLLKQHLL